MAEEQKYTLITEN